MQYAIISFRYLDRMSIVGRADTEEEAIKAIDVLTRREKEQRAKFWGFLKGDPLYFTYLPIGTP